MGSHVRGAQLDRVHFWGEEEIGLKFGTQVGLGMKFPTILLGPTCWVPGAKGFVAARPWIISGVKHTSSLSHRAGVCVMYNAPPQGGPHNRLTPLSKV